MIYILLGIGYVLFLAFLVRFFKAVHGWDEEIYSMEIRGKSTMKEGRTNGNSKE